jgi:hypothetical protein
VRYYEQYTTPSLRYTHTVLTSTLSLSLLHYQDVDPCINGCLNELQASLGTIFLTRLATGSILKLAVPYFTQKMKRANEAKGVDPDDLTDVEQAYIQDVSAVFSDVHCGAARLYAVVGDELVLLWH